MIRPVDHGQEVLMFDSRTLWHDENPVPWSDAMSERMSLKRYLFSRGHEGKYHVRSYEHLHHSSPQSLMMWTCVGFPSRDGRYVVGRWKPCGRAYALAVLFSLFAWSVCPQ